MSPRQFKPAGGSKRSAQLAAVLAAVEIRDKLAAASGADKLLQRKFQRALGDVVQAFAVATKKLVRGFQGQDYLGGQVDRDDLDQAVALGICEAVARYQPAKANGGCVFYVLSRVRFALQQLTGSQRQKHFTTSLEDVSEVSEFHSDGV